MKMISKESACPPHPVLLSQNALGHVNADTPGTRWWPAGSPLSCREPPKPCRPDMRAHWGLPMGLSGTCVRVPVLRQPPDHQVTPLCLKPPCTYFQIPEPLGFGCWIWDSRPRSSSLRGERKVKSETMGLWNSRKPAPEARFSFTEAAVTSHRGRKTSYSKTKSLRIQWGDGFLCLTFARRNPEKRGEFPECTLFLSPRTKTLELSGLSLEVCICEGL